MSCFSHLDCHSDKLVIFRVFMHHVSYHLHPFLLFHHHHHIPHLHHYCITPGVGMGPYATYHFSSSLLVYRYCKICFIYINLSLFFLQGLWNNIRVILLPIFTSSLSILRIDWISFFHYILTCLGLYSWSLS